MQAAYLFWLQLRLRWIRLLVWATVWVGVSWLFATVFHSISGDTANMMATTRQLSPELLSAINIDPVSYLSRVESFVSGQFMFIYLLAGSIFSFALGVDVIGRRIQDRTIANLLTKPLPRGRLYLVLLLANLTALVLVGILIASLSWLLFDRLSGQADVSVKYFANLHLGSTLVFMVFAALGQFAGALLNGGRAVLWGAGLAVISWFLATLGGLADLPDWIQRLAVYHYFDVDLLRSDFALDGGKSLILLGLVLAFALAGIAYFKRKNIYL